MYSSLIILAVLSAASALPTCPAVGQVGSVPYVVQQQQQEPQVSECTPEMLKGFRFLAPVNLEAKAEDAQDLLPSGAKYLDNFNTTIWLPSMSSQGSQSNATQSNATSSEKMEVKFTNDTEVSTKLLQNSAFAISWIYNVSEAGGQQAGAQPTNETSSGQGSQQSMGIMPIRIQLVDTQGFLSNVTETLGVLNVGENDESDNSTESGGQGGQTPQRNQTEQAVQGSQEQTNQTQQGGSQQGSETQIDSKSGAIVVLLGDEIPVGLYSFLATIRVNKTADQQSNCRILTQPFEIRSAMNLTEDASGAQRQNATTGGPQQNATSDGQQ